MEVEKEACKIGNIFSPTSLHDICGLLKILAGTETREGSRGILQIDMTGLPRYLFHPYLLLVQDSLPAISLDRVRPAWRLHGIYFSRLPSRTPASHPGRCSHRGRLELGGGGGGGNWVKSHTAIE